jgi:hypothetical protein
LEYGFELFDSSYTVQELGNIPYRELLEMIESRRLFIEDNRETIANKQVEKEMKKSM